MENCRYFVRYPLNKVGKCQLFLLIKGYPKNEPLEGFKTLQGLLFNVFRIGTKPCNIQFE